MRCPRCHRPLQPHESACSCGEPGASPAPAPAPMTREAHEANVELKPAFHGDGLTLLKLIVVNLLLTLVTLGVYYFWGKVRVRKYLHSQTSLAGDRFAYHGTGQELFFGALKGLLILGPLIALTVFVPRQLPEPWGELASVVLLYGGLLFFVPVLLVASWRYRLTRTSWRGIRFSFRGSAGEFLPLFIGGWMLTVLTLGLYYPYHYVRQRGFFVRNTYFGSRSFDFDAHGSEMLGPWFGANLLTFFTLGLSQLWLQAWRERFAWGHTTFGGARFSSSINFADLFGLTITNFFLAVLTLGIATPWIQVRTLRYHLGWMSLSGELDLDAVTQQARTSGAVGEELGEMLGTGALDLDLGV